MPAANLTMSMEQGANFYRRLTFKTGNTPIDITGWTVRGQMRETISSTTVIASFTTEVLDQITNTGEATFSLTAAQTAAIQPLLESTGCARKISKFVYDIEVVKPDTSVERILQGTIEFSPEVTR